MGKFDIKDFLQENKLTEVSQLNEKFIEQMDREVEDGIDLILKGFEMWAHNTSLKDNEVKGAKKEILQHLESELNRIR